VAERERDGLRTDLELVGILAVPHGIHGFDPQVGKHAREIAREAFRKIEAVLDTEQQ
jgi:hypothetical protein